jgi:hypothetical protein
MSQGRKSKFGGNGGHDADNGLSRQKQYKQIDRRRIRLYVICLKQLPLSKIVSCSLINTECI